MKLYSKKKKKNVLSEVSADLSTRSAPPEKEPSEKKEATKNHQSGDEEKKEESEGTKENGVKPAEGEAESKAAAPEKPSAPAPAGGNCSVDAKRVLKEEHTPLGRRFVRVSLTFLSAESEGRHQNVHSEAHRKGSCKGMHILSASFDFLLPLLLFYSFVVISLASVCTCSAVTYVAAGHGEDACSASEALSPKAGSCGCSKSEAGCRAEGTNASLRRHISICDMMKAVVVM
jgi:hypothetical protein